MISRGIVFRTLIGILVGAGAPGISQSAERRPVVIELFTSQGCSSCPPANANLVELGRRKDVLTLSFAVTYWDYLGWKDTFSKEEFTERQVTYEPKLGERGPFTPQMVINGRLSTVGNRLSEVESLIEDANIAGGPEVTLRGGRVAVGRGDAPAGGADIWLVRYEPDVIQVAVRRGENRGRTLPHAHVVRALVRLGRWDGKETGFAAPASKGDLATAVLVQERNGGAILAAVTD